MKMSPLERLGAPIQVSLLLSHRVQRRMMTCLARRSLLVHSSALPTSSVPWSWHTGAAAHRAGLEHFPFLQENAHDDTSTPMRLTWWFLQQFKSFGVCISRFLVLF